MWPHPESAEANSGVTRRVWREGNEIGNHTFRHPNLAETGEPETRLELNATQRAIESLTGHSTPLFRAPYNADSEPQTADEVVPFAHGEALFAAANEPKEFLRLDGFAHNILLGEPFYEGLKRFLEVHAP